MKNTNEKKEKDALGMYRRILRIDRLLSDGTYPTLEELEDDHEIEASRATVYRTLEFMRDQLNAPIVKDKNSRGFYYSDKTFRLPCVFITEQELIAVATLKNMLPSLQGTPLFDSAKQILELIEKSPVKNPSGMFEIADGESSDIPNSDWISNRYVFLDEGHTNVEKVIWDKIGNAMRQNKVIEFDYVREYDETSERRKVAPYQVLKSHENWTLWGYDYNRKDFRIFIMDRISKLKILNEKFTLPKDFEYEKHSFQKDSAWYNEEEWEYKIWISNSAKKKLRNYIWGRNRQMQKCKGGWEVTFSTSNYERLLEKVFSLTTDAHPIEPVEFVDDWAEKIKRLNGIVENANCFYENNLNISNT